MMLVRHPDNPVLQPNPFNAWEALNVFNPSVIVHDGLYHMHYRAQGTDYVSRIGYAVSRDGVHWNRLQEPVFEPSSDVDARGVEDPRITEIDGRFYMAYTASGRLAKHPETGTPASGITPMYAVSDDLITWERLGPVVEGEDNKDHALFPERVGGRFVTFHRRPPSTWLAFSSDLRSWDDRVEIIQPRPGLWDGKRVGAGGPPILTDEPILEPQETGEIKGDVPNVVFGTANPVVDGVVHLYYGAADRVIGRASAPLAALLAWTLEVG